MNKKLNIFFPVKGLFIFEYINMKIKTDINMLKKNLNCNLVFFENFLNFLGSLEIRLAAIPINIKSDIVKYTFFHTS